MKKYINNIDMKRQSILLIAMMMSIVASAQESIEQLFRSLDTRGDKTLLSKNHYEDNIDNPTTFCRYEEIMMTKKAFGKLEDEFVKTFTNEKDAYKLYRMTQDAPRTFKSSLSVPYGTQNEYSVTFGSHSDHNYLVALFYDKAKTDKRHAYALVWYNKGDNVIILHYHIYGNDPTKVSNTRVITYDGKQIIDNNGYVITGLKDLEPTINNDLDFMKRFGTLRASFVSTGVDKTLVLYGLVVKIAELCKNHGKLLTDNERTTCDKSLLELIKNNSLGDPYIAGMLEEARIALKK
ncbi:MAG: hypothetical protein MR923_12460 [Prevotella sp.]|nr:hypothetical protein [Prevotella sp.]MCI7017881.1 hypothetical protein [Prevotella sp.]